MSFWSPAPQFWGKFLAPLELLSQQCFIFFAASLIWNVVNLVTSSLRSQVSYFDTQINPKHTYLDWQKTKNFFFCKDHVRGHGGNLLRGGKGGGGLGVGVLPILSYTWRLRPTGVRLSGFRSQERVGISLVSWSTSKGREFSHRPCDSFRRNLDE